MITLSGKKIIGLSVATKSGFVLGKIIDFDVDIETQSILRYFVKNRSLTQQILSEKEEKIIISRNQVLSIDEFKMVVDDGAVKNIEKSSEFKIARENIPAMTRAFKTDGNSGQ
jgi:sporulation protein YlmC with PRC-barrel domain